jgi:hypothetical protein
MAIERRAPPTSDLPLKCPARNCPSTYAGIAIRSATVLTLRCPVCRFMWSANLADLPADVRALLDALRVPSVARQH